MAQVMAEAFALAIDLAVIAGGIYRLVDMGNRTGNIMKRGREVPTEAAT